MAVCLAPVQKRAVVRHKPLEFASHHRVNHIGRKQFGRYRVACVPVCAASVALAVNAYCCCGDHLATSCELSASTALRLLRLGLSQPFHRSGSQYRFRYQALAHWCRSIGAVVLIEYFHANKILNLVPVAHLAADVYTRYTVDPITLAVILDP